MKLYDKITVFGLVLAMLFLSGCTDDVAAYMGTWKRVADGDSMYRGFTLGGNGIAASINNTETQYNAWHRKRDTLWLSGKRFTDTTVLPFTDTMTVKKLSQDSLVLLYKGDLLHFSRE